MSACWPNSAFKPPLLRGAAQSTRWASTHLQRRSSMRLVSLSLICLVGFADVGRAQSVHPGLVGCYAFFDRAGRPAMDSLYWAPATARLDSGGRAVKLTPRFDPGRPAPGPGAYGWSIGGLGDSLHVLFHNGFSGTEFVLGRTDRGDTLRGRAREHWDFGPPYATEAGSATAVRISCQDAAGGRAPRT